MLLSCKSDAFKRMMTQNSMVKGLRERERRKAIIGFLHLIFNSKRKERNFKTIVATPQFKKYH